MGCQAGALHHRARASRVCRARGIGMMSLAARTEMTTPQRLLSSSVIGAIDQGLLSAFNLGLGVAFIKLATKADYADYALVTTALLLVQSLQNALVSSPLATLLPAAASGPRHDAIVHAGAWAQQSLAALIVLCCALAVACSAWLAAPRLGWILAASALAATGVMSREFVRACYFLRHDALGALKSDLLYVLLAIAGIGLLLWSGQLAAAPVLAVIGLAGLVAGALARLGMVRPGLRVASAHRDGLHALWDCARWALPSVLNSWLYANAFLFVVERLMHKEAVAELVASRLLLVPMSLLVVGWASAFRPGASRWLAAGRVDQVHRVALRSASAFVGLALVYGAVLWAVMPFIEFGLLGDKYRSAASLAGLWLIFFTVMSLRTVGMSCMLASPSAFKAMYWYSWLGVAVSLPATILASSAGSISGVVSGLIFAEISIALLIWCRGWPKIRADIERKRKV